ncbi:cytochrome P450 (plasmid) [Haloferax sp. S1W]|uniref:cytochrome P450 n=1 Tax=Haloferax sp. S1W TaxID=3377110 RepID=UPI0037CBA46C
MLDVDPPEHDRLRGVVDEYFHPGNLKKLRPSIRSIADEQLDQALEDGADVEIISEVTAPITVLTISRLLGIPYEQWDVIQQWSGAMDVDVSEGGGALFSGTGEYFAGLLEKRRQEPGDDLLSVIADPEIPLSEKERVSFCILLFLAGHFTTTHAIGNALWALEEEGLYGALRDGEIERTSTFEEALRYRGPVPKVSGRRTTEEVELSGTVIPAGEQVTAWIGAANRDPRTFDNPDQFDPERMPNPHIAFGSGPHRCLGAPLAKLEGDIIFEAITDRVEAIDVEESELVPNMDPIGHGFTRLPMKLYTEE